VWRLSGEQIFYAPCVGNLMNPQLSISPFGQRPLSLAMMASDAAAKACSAEKVVHKWAVHRSICEAKASIGVSDRALAVLHALLSFHCQTTLAAGDAVVFPSNRELTIRAHGMAPATLRRHLAMLVECGLIVRRDSPNGKRYARKDQAGEIERAFGFDLSPLVVRADEFEALAEAARQERRAMAMLKEEVSIYRRDIAKMIAVGLEEGIAGPWAEFHIRLSEESAARWAVAGKAEWEARAARLATLRAEVRNLFEDHIIPTNMSAKESQTERLYLDSNTEQKIESEPASENAGRMAQEPLSNRQGTAVVYPLMMVMKACPDIADYTRNGITTWSDLMDAASLVRPMLGISQSAFEEARQSLGPYNAAITIAAILQKGSAIRSPGGYLRVLTRKAGAGGFSLGPVLMALLKERSLSTAVAFTDGSFPM